MNFSDNIKPISKTSLHEIHTKGIQVLDEIIGYNPFDTSDVRSFQELFGDLLICEITENLPKTVQNNKILIVPTPDGGLVYGGIDNEWQLIQTYDKEDLFDVDLSGKIFNQQLSPPG